MCYEDQQDHLYYCRIWYYSYFASWSKDLLTEAFDVQQQYFHLIRHLSALDSQGSFVRDLFS